MIDILLDFVPFERMLQVGWQQDRKMWVSVDGTLCSDSGLSKAHCLGLGQTCPSTEGKKRTGKKIIRIQCWNFSTNTNCCGLLISVSVLWFPARSTCLLPARFNSDSVCCLICSAFFQWQWVHAGRKQTRCKLKQFVPVQLDPKSLPNTSM